MINKERIRDVDVDVEVPSLSKDIPKRIKHSERHAKAWYSSVHHRWMEDALFRDSQEKIDWTEDFCHEWDQVGTSTWRERKRYNKCWYSFKSALTLTRQQTWQQRNRALLASRCARNFAKQRELSQQTDSTTLITSRVFNSDNNGSGRSSRSNSRSSGKAGGPQIGGYDQSSSSWQGWTFVVNFNATFFLPSCATSLGTEKPAAVEHFKEYCAFVFDREGFLHNMWQPLCGRRRGV